MKAVIAGLLLAGACLSQAQLFINEIMVDPTGSDNGFEFFELRSSAANFDMTGLSLIVIEGDGTAAGVIDGVYSLTGFATGSNGLFLRRDAATVLNPSPESATTVQVLDFSPDLENGTATYALVRDFTGAVTNDLDTNNDGILDSTPWASVVDAISLLEGDSGVNVQYGAALGGAQFIAVPAGFQPNTVMRLSNSGQWLTSDIVADVAPGPYFYGSTATILQDGSLINTADLRFNGGLGNFATPGSANAELVPEPATLLALGAGLVAMARRRRKA